MCLERILLENDLHFFGILTHEVFHGLNQTAAVGALEIAVKVKGEKDEEGEREERKKRKRRKRRHT